MEFFNPKKRKTEETKLVAKGSPKKKAVKTATSEYVKRKLRRGKKTKLNTPINV